MANSWTSTSQAKKIVDFTKVNNFNVLSLEAALAVGRPPADGFTNSVAVGICGQSLPLGAILEPDAKGVMRKAFYAAPAINYHEPDKLAPGQSGSYFTPVFQLLAVRDRIRVFPCNGALGGASLIKDFCGVLYFGWAANKAYRGMRAAGTAGNILLSATTNVSNKNVTVSSTTKLKVGMPIYGNANIPAGATVESITSSTVFVASLQPTVAGTANTWFTSDFINGDPGTKGEMIYESGRWWECTTGNRHLAFIDSKIPVECPMNSGFIWRSNLTYVVKDTTIVSGATKPVFPTDAVVGQTVNDNGLVWTCRLVQTNSADADGMRVLRIADYGHDPYYGLERLINEIMAQPVAADKKYCIVQNAQSDAGSTTSLYTFAHRFICNRMAANNIKTIHGMCLYYPALGQAGYDAIETSLSGGGLAATPDYANSPLATALVVQTGYTMGVPGGAVGHFYIIKSLYRHFGLDVNSMLQQPQPNPHVHLAGGLMCAFAMYPDLRKIFLDVAN